jgi:hypothetical protein
VRRTWLIAVAAACGACGGHGPRAPTPTVANAAGAPAQSRAERAIATLHDLAAALRDDDSLAPVLDPDGTELFWTPADITEPWFVITPEATQTMHELMAMHGWREPWGDYTSMWRDIEAGLAALDIDPAAIVAGVHDIGGSCDDYDPNARHRAYLRTHDVETQDYGSGPRSPAFTLEFHYLWLRIYLIERDGRTTIGRIEPHECG